ncbi:MAG: hypothetical protein JF631_08190, partial [Mycobacterium sp.]|nr:hypothetical protein [Mycobacterium sp.]
MQLIAANPREPHRAPARTPVDVPPFGQDERDPRDETALGVRARRGEQPWQVGVIELDVRQIVDLRVDDVGLRVSPDHLSRIDLRNVRRSVDADTHLGIEAAAIIDHGDAHVDRAARRQPPREWCSQCR